MTYTAANQQGAMETFWLHCGELSGCPSFIQSMGRNLCYNLLCAVTVKILVWHFSRSGITQTSCTKPCRRRTRPTSRTWTSMTSLQPVTPAAPHRVRASKPKPTRATAKSTTPCRSSILLRKEPIRSSHMNGYVVTVHVKLIFT